ncbi:hypothetical protein [Leptolyngbya sp. 7M]|uniref:hypothetical protein n=1 Tax=Leptolyngbya sp. 7M TaxID=2812896 RepID=UPI001B8AE990|nr:hypothetical protein [Leptolyngbya sp. 7M]QYO66543.1 hypothetical protein JVX88_07005 [Leptolyngbya sp. 7M]
MNFDRRSLNGVFSVFLLTILVVGAGDVFGQTARRPTNSTRPAASPTPDRLPVEVISRADQYIDQNGRVVTPESSDLAAGAEGSSGNDPKLAELELRIRQLEAAGKDAKDEKKDVRQSLALNLDILTKAEQRVESLRKQYFEMVEKEGEIQRRLDTLEVELRPESIEKNVAFAGSLRPEALREARQKNLAAERTKLQNLLTEIQRNKAAIEANIMRADQLVERLRVRLEKEIDSALGDGTQNYPL